MNDTVLVIPPNDPEAMLIRDLAEAMGLPVLRSDQPHGAALDREPALVRRVLGGKWKRVVIVEMPGPKSEAALRRAGVDVRVIDHHHYTDLDRAHDAKGRPLPSSLEQFLSMFCVTDARLRALGYDPKAVRGIGIMDRGFFWALRAEGYGPREEDAVLALRRELLRRYGMLAREERQMRVARRAWARRSSWRGYQIVESRSASGVREGVSYIAARELGRPTPAIFVERARGLLYVQESDRAMELFRAFGGFTFGLDRNWGYRNAPGKARVTLRDVKRVLAKPVDKRPPTR